MTNYFKIFLILGVLCSSGLLAQKSSDITQGEPLSSDEWTYATFNVVPGFLKLRIDYQQVLGFSDEIILSAGGHWVEVIAPPGYQDTSFKIQVLRDQKFRQEVRLREIKTGRLAPVGVPKASVKSKTLQHILAVSSLTLGGMSTYLAYREHNRSERSLKKAKNVADQSDLAEQAWKDQSDLQIQDRNRFAIMAGVGLGLGLTFWLAF